MVGTGPPETCAGVAPDLTNGTVGMSLSRQTDNTISTSGVGPEISRDGNLPLASLVSWEKSKYWSKHFDRLIIILISLM